jgi:hypothetical protein
VRFTAPEFAPTVGVCVVVTPDAVFGSVPAVVLVTTKVTVQLPPAGIVMPLKESAVAPAVSVAGVMPGHVPPTVWFALIDMLVSVSVNAAPVSGPVFAAGLVSVSVTVEVAPAPMVAGANAFAIVGGAHARRVAVSLLLQSAFAGAQVVVPVFDLVPAVVAINGKPTTHVVAEARLNAVVV